MKPQPISEISTENLKKNYKAMKFVAGILLGSLIVMVGSGIYVTIRKGIGVSFLLPFAFLPLLIVNITSFKK